MVGGNTLAVERDVARPAARSRARLVLIGTTVFAALVGILVVPFPFFGDQALFSVFGRMMGEGAALYRDLWDVKQPGIFWFYELVGGVIAFDEIAVHAVEVIYWLLNGVLIAVALRRLLKRAWVACLFPLIAAIYFAAAGINDLSQVESLLSPIVFWVVWFLLDGEGRPPLQRRAFLAGLAAGALGVFKLLALVIPVFVLIAAIIQAWIRGERTRQIAGWVGTFALGAAVPLAAMLIWAVINGLWHDVWFTWVEYPPEVLDVAQRPLGRLVDAGREFVLGYAVLILLAGYRLVRASARGRRTTALLLVSLLGCGAYVVLQLWWGYLFLAAIVPLGVIALQGLDDLLDANRRVVVSLGLIGLLVALPLGGRLSEKTTMFMDLVGGQTLEEYQTFAPSFAEDLEESTAVDVGPGQDVYVLGSPGILYLQSANQSMPVNGWSPEFWTDEIWHWVARDLAAGETEKLYVADWVASLARERAPWFEADLASSYELEIETGRGRWLVPRR